MSSRILSFGLFLALWPSLASAQADIPASLQPLLTPQISSRASERMLVVEAQGDPSTVAARAFGLLFQLYYQIPETPKGPQQPVPRARWPIPFDQPRSSWVGLYALPVPETVAALPSHVAPEGFKVALTTWEYGMVAEVLHVGPYEEEEPTLRRLESLANEKGYEVTGEHEEEYIRGPTMTGPGDPAHYLTILRYRVRKKP